MNKNPTDSRVVLKPPLVIIGVILTLLLSACTGRSLPSSTNTPEPTVDSVSVTTINTSVPDEPPPQGAEQEFSTDFSIHSVSYDEILSGGPPKDGIPALDNPQFISLDNINDWLDDLEPVIVFENQGDVHIYPLQILIWHEIVNDVVGELPVVVTFCPLCNTAIAFDATYNNMVLDFGTTGRLRYSNLVMYDRQTETWWQQATGTAIAGELTGSQLTFLPTNIIS